MKILYACRKNYTSKIQCERFLSELKSNHIVKVAAYHQYVPFNFCDWTLDAVSYTFKHSYLFRDNDHLNVYKQQVKAFNPDLIISDLEEFTSYIANVLKIPLWHVSQDLLYFALSSKIKQKIQVYRYNNYLLYDDKKLKVLKNLISKAEKNYIYSHFANLDLPINKKFDWVKPYYKIGKPHQPCNHSYVAINANHNYEMLNYLKDKNDCVLFTPNIININNVSCKSLYDKDEYICNLSNAECVISDGDEHTLIDSLFNNKDCIIIPNKSNKESIINYSIHKNIYCSVLADEVIMDSQLYVDSKVKQLHQLLENA